MACIRSNRFCACVQEKLCQLINNKNATIQNQQNQILFKKDFTTSAANLNKPLSLKSTHLFIGSAAAAHNTSFVRNVSKKCQVSGPNST